MPYNIKNIGSMLLVCINLRQAFLLKILVKNIKRNIFPKSGRRVIKTEAVTVGADTPVYLYQRIFMYKELTAAPFVVTTSVFCCRKPEATV